MFRHFVTRKHLQDLFLKICSPYVFNSERNKSMYGKCHKSSGPETTKARNISSCDHDKKRPSTVINWRFARLTTDQFISYTGISVLPPPHYLKKNLEWKPNEDARAAHSPTGNVFRWPKIWNIAVRYLQFPAFKNNCSLIELEEH